MKGQLKTRIASNLDNLDRGKSKASLMRFALPDELHTIPLYERELFTQLVEFHNRIATPLRFVHPFTLMILDPDIGIYRPQGVSENAPAMQNSSSRILDYYLAMQDQAKPAIPQAVLGHMLFWEQGHDEPIEALSCGVYIYPNPGEKYDVSAISAAPSFPSWQDQELMMQDASATGPLAGIRNSLKRFTAGRRKTFEQKGGMFGKVIDLDTAAESVFVRWCEENRYRINMEPFEGLAGYSGHQVR